jgi:hypothetical protein
MNYNKQRSANFTDGFLIGSYTLWKLCCKYQNWLLYFIEPCLYIKIGSFNFLKSWLYIFKLQAYDHSYLVSFLKYLPNIGLN